MANNNKTVKQLEEETNKKFDDMNNNILKVLELVQSVQAPKTEEVKTAESQAKTAEPENTYKEPVHPDWIADALEKLGEKLDHCEIHYPKKGFPMYTIVIKNEHSNAPKAYLEFYKVDRRTVPVTDGFETVKVFNSLVAQNFKLNPIVK